MAAHPWQWLGIVTGLVDPPGFRSGNSGVRVRVGILLPIKNPYPGPGYGRYQLVWSLKLTRGTMIRILCDWPNHMMPLHTINDNKSDKSRSMPPLPCPPSPLLWSKLHSVLLNSPFILPQKPAAKDTWIANHRPLELSRQQHIQCLTSHPLLRTTYHQTCRSLILGSSLPLSYIPYHSFTLECPLCLFFFPLSA